MCWSIWMKHTWYDIHTCRELPLHQASRQPAACGGVGHSDIHHHWSAAASPRAAAHRWHTERGVDCIHVFEPQTTIKKREPQHRVLSYCHLASFKSERRMYQETTACADRVVFTNRKRERGYDTVSPCYTCTVVNKVVLSIARRALRFRVECGID